MECLAGWWEVLWSTIGKQLLWSGLIVLLGDALSDSDSTAHVTTTCPIHIFPTSNTSTRKHHLWKKNYWWKNRLFFITENFLGILKIMASALRLHVLSTWSLSAEAMIFSVWHRPLLGQHPVDVIFFSYVNVCQSVFCVF